MSHLIRLKSNPDLVLAHADGNVVLAWRNVTDKHQLWTIEPIWKEKHLYRVRNLGASHDLSCADYGNHVRLEAGNLGNPWEICGAFSQPDAIRVHNHADWNLNVLGDGPYDVGRRVGVWNWDGGAANERWTIADASTVPSPVSADYYAFLPGYGSPYQLAVKNGDAGGVQPLVISRGISGHLVQFSVFTWALGFALQNRYNKKFVEWAGANRPLRQAAAMSLDCVWTWGGKRGTRYGAIRPVRDSDQNLNVYGAPSPPTDASVGTWRWSGGKDNEVWEQFKVDNPDG